ncbi:627_t:CDS:2 [Funneliformis caledonium]|uniref:627_t:CDS:1 n=1 Tax=Funneliformis caledonium TaxID=1117310 RepID=A0A9N9BCR3_9GLOM|nr:627_t:CDS:2 [Funneliformis caledonium]
MTTNISPIFTGLDVDSYKQKNIERMNRKSGIEFYSSWKSRSPLKSGVKAGLLHILKAPISKMIDAI